MLLSIVICNYNYAPFLNDAIRSALEQTYRPAEVIVVDDGSTDGSPSIIEYWRERAGIRAIHQPNAGQVAAYNRGFSEARGDVVVFLDSDDTLDAGAGERIMAAFEEPEVVKVHFRLALVDAQGRPLGTLIPHRLSDGDVSSYLRSGLLYDSSPGSGNAYRRAALARLMPLPVDDDDRHAADFFALQGIAQLGRVRALEAGPLGTYRCHTPEASNGMWFGNADWTEQTRKRYARLRAWLPDRLGLDYAIPAHFVDFSTDKLEFADAVFLASGYWRGVRQGVDYFGQRLAYAIWRRSAPLPERVALLGWAVAVIALPRPLGRRIARYVCNPASRSRAARGPHPASSQGARAPVSVRTSG
jgi:glycosyltransferase involved in cell wall biosynthesis